MITSDAECKQHVRDLFALTEKDAPTDAELVEIERLSAEIQAYDDPRDSFPRATPADCLSLLMVSHSLGAEDMTELGSAEDARLVLAGEREITAEPAAALGVRFHITAKVFERE